MISSTIPQKLVKNTKRTKISKTKLFGEEEIRKTLNFYKETYITRAVIDEDSLWCEYKTFDYPFTKESTKHFTRTHALLFITQASYLIAITMKEIDAKWPLERKLAEKLAREEQMTFTKVELNFKKFIKNKDGIMLQIKIPKYRKIKNRLYVDLEYCFPAGCYGSCKAIIALDAGLVIEK